MAFDATPGGDPRGPWCRACKQPIEAGQASETVEFKTDAEMSGLYHRACAKPFQSLAAVLNLDWRAGR